MNERIDFFIATLEANLQYGMSALDAVAATVDDYKAVFLPGNKQAAHAPIEMLESMVETATQARKSGRLCYLHVEDGKYVITTLRSKSWLFRAYPGGRMEMSSLGKSMLGKEAGD